MRFPAEIEAQLLEMADAYAFIRQAIADRLSGSAPTLAPTTDVPSLLAPGKLLQIPNRRIEVRAIVDDQVAYRFKSESGWQYAIQPLKHFESLIRRKSIREVSKL